MAPRTQKQRSWRRRIGAVCALASVGCMIASIVVFYRGIAVMELRDSVGARHPRRGMFLGMARTNAAEHEARLCDRDLYPQPWNLRSDQVTVLMNGFSEARIQLLERHAQAYSASPVVDSIYILWGNTSTPNEVLQQANFESLGAPIHVVRQPSPSLNARFLPRSYVKTRAVLICDDDISVDLPSLKFALQVWMENQGRIVGFFPRAHSYQLHQKSWIYSKQANRYSIMLTKLMIMATEYLYLYSCKMPAGVKEYVDEGLNCEDIAMNFLVTNHSRQGPLLVEGNPQDWGDTRNSNAGLSVGLSARSGHRKDRGECIAAFHRAWGGTQLRYSYVKAVPDVGEQVLCDKFGLALDCDKAVGSKREALRLGGRNVVTSTLRFAYVTVLLSKESLNASVVLAESLRSTGTVYDIVVLLDPKSRVDADDDLLEQHFDLVKYAHNRFDVADMTKLNLWLLVDYAKVVFIDLNAVVLSSLDHLFELPEIAGAPHLERPGKFDVGLLVLRPSNATYKAMIGSLQEKSTSTQEMTMDWFLNEFFRDWFQMPAEHRLPSCYGVPASIALKPLGFNRESTYKRFGSPLVVYGMNDSHSELLKTSLGSTAQHVFSWPTKAYAVVHSRSAHSQREAFVTVLWNDRVRCLEVWLESFKNEHSNGHPRDKVLLVLSTLNRATWLPYAERFDTVITVNPISKDQSSVTVLHLWNQTRYRKLVYVDACSIFLDNCNFFFDYDPFAAVPSALPADAFSTSLMVVKPCENTFKLLVSKVEADAAGSEQGLEGFLNDFFSGWYQGRASQRIHPGFVDDRRFGGTNQLASVYPSYTRAMVFSSVMPTWSSLSNWSEEIGNMERAWTEAVCQRKLGMQSECS